MANTRWLSASRHVCTLFRPRTVSYGSYLFPRDIYRFDGIRFLPWRLPAGVPIDRSINIFADHAGGLWVLGPADIVRLKAAAVSSHFQLEGGMFQSVTEAPDGSLWVLRGNSDAPLCRVTDSIKCFGKADGIPISDIQSVLADGNGGFWLGGRAGGLVHWHAGTSEKLQRRKRSL